ncbi:hypothetical protein UFOVP9_6 [uncultured Caudovirales phage]|jgi:hypothetical protein|uniref:Uncharacterized protein n=1 Tax=uncultured Caudovirales phage TaxID=2100421 RepID=A0A6J5KGK2_9CAUD|nr:hypothetical protein UFOVP9_6 [uncultured Caudovirales phage]
MADFTQSAQGYFTSTGASTTIALPGGTTWMAVRNWTQMAASQTTALGVSYYWQFGMPSGSGLIHYKSNAADAANLDGVLTSPNGFTFIDSSYTQYGVINATITAISNASIPVVTNTGTNALSAGSVVRLFNVDGAQQLGGMDFTVGYNTLSSTTFSLDYMSQIVAGTTGSWMQVEFPALFYPVNRSITSITQAANAVVTLSVTHGYQVGQVVRMNIPSIFGMQQMNNIQATIIAVNTATTGSGANSITLNVNSSSFNAFAFPLTANYPFTPAQTVPMAENTAVAQSLGVDYLNDATLNVGFIGMTLAGGANCPGGADDDLMYWISGTSFTTNSPDFGYNY